MEHGKRLSLAWVPLAFAWLCMTICLTNGVFSYCLVLYLLSQDTAYMLLLGGWNLVDFSVSLPLNASKPHALL
jgi:hypothetical protein